MDYITVIFNDAKLLFEYFGWYSILLVVGVFGLMIPLNLLYKKVMKKESLNRLRKLISALSVYVVSLGLIALFTGVVIKAPLTTSYLIGATIPCGFLAQMLWAIVKVVRDYGLDPILKSVAESKQAKAWITNLGLSDDLVKTITASVDKYLSSVDAKTFEDVVNQEINIRNDLKVKLAGFVAEANMDEAVTKMVETVTSKYPKAKVAKTEKVEETAKPAETENKA